MYSFVYGQFKIATPDFNAVNAISFDTDLKKNFFSISLAIIGSNIIDVFPSPEPPTTRETSNLLFSGIFIVLAVFESLQSSTSQVYGPVPSVDVFKLIPL